MNSDSSKVKGKLKKDKTVNIDVKLNRGGLNLGYVKSKTTNIKYVTSCKENKAEPSAKTAKEEKPKSTENKKKNK
jgi:hypothetical protein